nr:MAG TPA: PR domain-containing protein 11 Genomics Consortium, SGC, Histone.73A [Bacteriophage sp.]
MTEEPKKINKKRPTAANSRTAVNSQPMCFYCT